MLSINAGWLDRSRFRLYVDCVLRNPPIMDSVIWTAEITDTFGGEANYSWVNRAEFTLPATATRRQIVSAGKKALGYNGIKCDTYDLDVMYELRPRGECTVIFIN